MRTKLNIAQRWGAISLLAGIQQGTFKELKLAKKALEILTISAKEIEEHGLKVEGKMVVWNKKTEKKEKEFTLDDAVFPLMSKKLTELNEQGAMRGELYDIAEKLGIE